MTDYGDIIRVLIVEDDAKIAARLAETLTEAGFVAEHTADGEHGWELGAAGCYDAAILDLGLPNLSGIQILTRWRKAGIQMPVLILTARDNWTERVEGLNAGADDYLGKPFQSPEVVARINALIRRSTGNADPILRHGDIELDPTANAVTLAGVPIDLTARELRILTYLMRRRGRIVSQSELIDNVYTIDETRESNTIEVYIGRLRKKLGRDVIRTFRGLGYRMET